MPQIFERLRSAVAGSYDVQRELGHGGHAVVFLACDLRHHRRKVAIKVLNPEIASQLGADRFLREIETTSDLRHPNILPLYDSGNADGLLYYVMPYVEGGSLRDRLTREPQLPVEEALRIAGEIADALGFAHGQEVVHRDIKPENIMMESGHAVLADFGIARAIHAAGGTTLTGTNVAIGTPGYMSPEQCAGDHRLDHRSDQYSLACVFYEMLAGQPPFTGPTAESLIYQHLSVEPRPVTTLRPSASESLARVLARGLSKVPADRFPTAVRFVEELVAAAGVKRTPRPLPLRGLQRWTALALAVIAIAVAVLMVRQRIGALGPRSLAVVPFVNISGDPSLDYVGEGLAADVLGRLVQVKGLNVASMSSTRSARDARKEATAIARRLDVRNVIEGTIQRRVGGLDLDVQLVDGRNGRVRWAGDFQRTMEDLPRLAVEISASLAIALGESAVPKAEAGQEPTASSAAYDYFLQGTRLLESPDPEGPGQAAAMFARAIELDGEYADAHAGLSKALYRQYRSFKDPNDLRRAAEASERAVRLNPRLLEARLARAQMLRFDGKFEASIAEIASILEANPSWDEAHLQLMATYRDAGDLVHAEQSARHALKLRPNWWGNWNSLGGVLKRKGDYPGAKSAYQRVIELLPEDNLGYEQVAAIEMLEGRFDAAIAEYERLRGPVKDGTLASNIGTAYFYAGRLSEAERYFTTAASYQPRNASRWQSLGDLHRRRGHADSARACYGKAITLAEGQLALQPEDRDLALQRALLLAKAGLCERAEHELAGLLPKLSATNADHAHGVARVHALCGRRAEALAALTRAVSQGFNPRFITLHDEYRSLAALPEFQRLTRRRPARG